MEINCFENNEIFQSGNEGSIMNDRFQDNQGFNLVKVNLFV